PVVIDGTRTASLWAPAWGGSLGRQGGGGARVSAGRWAGGQRAGSGERAFGSAPAASRAPVEQPAEEASQDAPRYVKGERVRHRRFGSGTIQGLSGGGRDLKVSVAFDDEDVGVKQLLVAYAGLERDWEGA